MIRRAKFADIPRLADLLTEMYERSRYCGLGGIDLKEARAILMQSIQRSGGKGPGHTLVNVAERNGAVEGFRLDVLNRVYEIGIPLWATDVWFYVSPRGDARDAGRLIDDMIAWAAPNPRVIEIKPAITDAIGDWTRTARLYERRGFRTCGTILQRSFER